MTIKVNKTLGFTITVGLFYFIFIGKEEYDNLAEAKTSVEDRFGVDQFFFCQNPEEIRTYLQH